MSVEDYIKSTIRSCTNCHLHKSCKSPVPYEAPFDTTEVLIIGEAPGANEDEEGRPFVGRSGRFLRSQLDRINAVNYAFANTVCCRPPNNNDPKIPEIAACSENLKLQLEYLNPKVIVLAGRFSTHLWRTDVKLINVRGRVAKWNDRYVVPVYHPAFVLRKTGHHDIFREDLRVAFKIPRVKNIVSMLGDECLVCDKPLDYYDMDLLPWCKEHWQPWMGVNRMEVDVQMELGV